MADPSVAPDVNVSAVEVAGAGAGGEKYLAFEANGAKYWRISNAGEVKWAPTIGNIDLFSDSNCTDNIDLNNVTNTSAPAKSDYPLKYAFDTKLDTYYRPEINNSILSGNNNWAAHQIWIQFEFEFPVTVSCVRTAPGADGCYGLGYSPCYADYNPPYDWDAGILLEASGDGSTWVTVADPDTGSNDVVATGDVGVLFPFDYTVTFPEATTGEVLVVSGTEYAYDSSIDLPAGSYTVTVGAGESKLTHATQGDVASSTGGTGWSGSLTNAITGVDATYNTPQVILRYNTEVCSDTSTTTPAPTPPPYNNTHNVTFLLAKGNVSHTAITSPRQTSIQDAIAVNLTGGDATRVHIAEVKDSPRRPGQEANMVILVEADDSATSDESDKVDFIAGKADWVAAQVRGVLDAEGLNVCGCNAASLVNSEIQTSINC